MDLMSAYTPQYIEAIEHLPDGAMLRLEDISWDDYEQLLEELSEWPGVRVSYDHGRVEIMSPLPEHEEYKDFIYSMVRTLAEEMNLNLETRGSTTFKKKGDLKGTEPDASLYVQNADSLVGSRRIDLNVDPPPDIVLEVDITNESLSKFPIYAAFGVPEIWRYNGKQALIYHLVDQDYVEALASRSFHGLTAQAIADSVELSKTEGQSQALIAFRTWVRTSLRA